MAAGTGWTSVLTRGPARNLGRESCLARVGASLKAVPFNRRGGVWFVVVLFCLFG